MMLSDDQIYNLHLGDAIPHMAEMPPASVDLAVYSPPFPAVYAYTSLPEDIGNSEDLAREAKLHFGFFFRQIVRVVKPGRVMVVHCTQIPRMKRCGGEGIFDFRGLLIRLAERAGFVFEYDWVIRKNPQSQAIRTRSRELQFAGLEADRAKSRGAIPDYLLKFRAPGENVVQIKSEGQVSRNQWIDWAECCWGDIRETDTLNVAEGRSESDTRHICLAKGSLVLTREQGYIPIETVAPGMQVLTHKGRWMPVLARRCNGVAPIIRTTAQGVADLRTTPDHKLWMRQAPGGWKAKQVAMGNEPSWVEAKDGLGSYVNLKLPPVEDSTLTEDEWWIVGRWLGDGHRGGRKNRGKNGGVGQFLISCSHKEADGLIARLGSHAGHAAKVTATQIAVVNLRPEVRDVLSRCGNGAVNKHVPAEAFALTKEKAEALLSGYLSADGHYVARHERWMASSVSRSLLLGMAMVAQRARGSVASVYAGRHPREGVIQGRTVNMAQDWVFMFRQTPGYRPSGWIGSDGAWKKVREIEDAGESEVWDLKVAEDSSFTAEGAIVHNCPLQLGVIDRIVRLYSNPGEVVFSPFAGIGSELYTALKLGRRAYGCEIKPEYFAAAKKNCERAIAIARRSSLQAGDLFESLA